MPKGIQKSLQLYLSKLKKANHVSDAGRFFSGCKYPRTTSFAGDRVEGKRDAATLKDIDQFLYENFSSLYNDQGGEEEEGGGDKKDVILCESPKFTKTPPDLRASRRFFVSTSDESCLASDAGPAGEDDGALPGDSFAVLTYSRRPYDDFRRSMQEMVEARRGAAAALDWDFMEELLFCYLKLNERRAHKYILGAFVDLMVSFRRETDRAAPPPPAAAPERRTKKALKDRQPE